MTTEPTNTRRRRGRLRRFVRWAFLLWAVGSTSWLVNTMRTRGVDDALLLDGPAVAVVDGEEMLEFRPATATSGAGLVFLCGGGVAAPAYAPLLRPIAESGHPVFIVKLPWRLAPLESHKAEAIARVREITATHGDIERWVVAGHSLGGALTARLARSAHERVVALVLIGTTHPKEDDLSFLEIPVTKVYGTNDGVAPVERALANRHLLPARTRWVEIEGGNHSQFGHYGHQLFDGDATISREEQQALTRLTLLEVLAAVAE